jgi:hypothetical protein
LGKQKIHKLVDLQSKDGDLQPLMTWLESSTEEIWLAWANLQGSLEGEAVARDRGEGNAAL